MEKKSGSLFELAEKQLRKEKKNVLLSDIIDRAILMRRELDNREALKERICTKVTQYSTIYKR